jgi:hypothetical protein
VNRDDFHVTEFPKGVGVAKEGSLNPGTAETLDAMSAGNDDEGILRVIGPDTGHIHIKILALWALQRVLDGSNRGVRLISGSQKLSA